MYLVRAMDILSILALDVFIEDGPIVTSIALWIVFSPKWSWRGSCSHEPVEKWKVSLEYCGKAPMKPCKVAQNAGAAAAVELGISVTLRRGFE